MNPGINKEAKFLAEGISFLARKMGVTRASGAQEGQPFDRFLLKNSRLYRRSRTLFLENGGIFKPSLLSSERTLSSVALLRNAIEYSPIEQELIWRATDPIEKKRPEFLLTLRLYSTSLFHEQNHRILWKFLPGAPMDPKALQRYLNFAESLVITLDMALADALSSEHAQLLYRLGVIYDPGTDVRRGALSVDRRQYRNYLQATLLATYLNLEQYDPDRIPKFIQSMFPVLGELAVRAAERSIRLDRKFVNLTNPIWQKKNRTAIVEALHRPGKNALVLSSDPRDSRLQYLWAEKVLDWVGL